MSVFSVNNSEYKFIANPIYSAVTLEGSTLNNIYTITSKTQETL